MRAGASCVPRSSNATAKPWTTARWRLHSTFSRGELHLPNAHPRWPLRRAELLKCDEDLIAAAGLPAPIGAPDSVLYFVGVPVRFGRPTRM